MAAMESEQQMENRKKFREKVEAFRERDWKNERESGVPSMIRAELVMRKFAGMPKRVVWATMDEFYPDVTRDFARDVVETMLDISERTNDSHLSLNHQRREWLNVWAESTPEAKESQSDDKIERAIKNAIKNGLIIKVDNKYDWQKTKTLLAYFIGRVYCNDRLAKGDRIRWEHTGGYFPVSFVMENYLVKGNLPTHVEQLRQNKFSSVNHAPPMEYESVEKCLCSL